jgi:hypothetical protein
VISNKHLNTLKMVQKKLDQITNERQWRLKQLHKAITIPTNWTAYRSGIAQSVQRWGYGPDDPDFVSRSGKRCFFYWKVLTGSGTQPASYSVTTGVYYRG